MKKLLVIVIFAVVTIAAIAAAVILITGKPSASSEDKQASIEKLDSFDVALGKYYLNGDTSKRYFEVTKDTVQLLGTDITAYVKEMDDRLPYYDPETGERVYQSETGAKADIEKYSKAQSYVVVCMNGADGSKSYILSTDYHEEDKFISGSGYAYNPEKKILCVNGIDTYILK